MYCKCLYKMISFECPLFRPPKQPPFTSTAPKIPPFIFFKETKYNKVIFVVSSIMSQKNVDCSKPVLNIYNFIYERSFNEFSFFIRNSGLLKKGLPLFLLVVFPSCFQLSFDHSLFYLPLSTGLFPTTIAGMVFFCISD